MIINHTHKFIFIKTQKTASTSIEIALSGLCTKDDVLTPISVSDESVRKELGYLSPINYKIPFRFYSKRDLVVFLISGKRKAYYNHMSCSEIKNLIGDNKYDDYYKFCFERNPYDKAISLFYHQGGFKKWDSIEQFIKDGELGVIKGFDQYTINKIIAVDDIFKFENIPEALIKISNKLNLKETLKLPKKRLKSQFRKDKRPYKEVLSEKEKNLIDSIWAREKHLMGYNF